MSNNVNSTIPILDIGDAQISLSGTGSSALSPNTYYFAFVNALSLNETGNLSQIIKTTTYAPVTNFTVINPQNIKIITNPPYIVILLRSTDNINWYPTYAWIQSPEYAANTNIIVDDPTNSLNFFNLGPYNYLSNNLSSTNTSSNLSSILSSESISYWIWIALGILLIIIVIGLFLILRYNKDKTIIKT